MHVAASGFATGVRAIILNRGHHSLTPVRVLRVPADYGAVPAACALNGSRFMGREIAVATSTPLNKETAPAAGVDSLCPRSMVQACRPACEQGLWGSPCVDAVVILYGCN